MALRYSRRYIGSAKRGIPLSCLMWENRRHLSVHAHLEQPSFPTRKVLKHNEPEHTITIVADLEILSSPEADCPC
ncbi:LOW QUALITY PROTEIN: uncharacterized protein [Drosophila suzukii]|uniref:LOW QUALITY PROTEIN: uncharacterized protein n=1 Tax=Drosophila suzukii TaxID=28584 RepID=A0AB40DH52_DROSZ